MRQAILALIFWCMASPALQGGNAFCAIEQLMKALKEKPDLARDFIGNDKSEAEIAGCTWDEATKDIMLGNFELMGLLSPYADASYAEELRISKSLSIFYVTDKALKFRECIPDTNEPSLPDWIELLQVGFEKVKAVKAPDLKKLKKKCIAQYKTALESARKEYKEVCILKSRSDTWSAGCFKSDQFEWLIGKR